MSNCADVECEKFQFLGGWLCLDFVNTLDERSSASPIESLLSYSDLARWGLESEALTQHQTEGLIDSSTVRVHDAALALTTAIDLRETIFRIFFALTQDEAPADLDIVALHTAIVDATANSELAAQSDRFIMDWPDDPTALDRVTWAVAQSAANLLTSGFLDRVKACDEGPCRWIFLDTSRNGRRRWCDMKICGNRAKARAHYQRQKSASEG